jgi:hypothetical protein
VAIRRGTIDRNITARALAGTIVANMALKMLITILYGGRNDRVAAAGLAASAAVLAATVIWRLTAI